MLSVTESAEQYLVDLLDKKPECIGVKISINNGGTPLAKTAMSYCKVGEVNSGYQIRSFGQLDVYVDTASEHFLEGASIDYVKDSFGGQLQIKAPNSRLSDPGPDASIFDRANYVLWTDVYPIVEQHNGTVNLVAITTDGVAVLEFGGGCKGCAGIDITLKESVESVFAEKLPEIVGIQDATDHTDDSQAYIARS